MDERRLPEGDLPKRKASNQAGTIFLQVAWRRSQGHAKNWKRGRPCNLAEVNVLNIYPAFDLEVSNFLPIYYLDGNEEGHKEGRDTEIPGSFVRDYEGSVLIFPVENH